LRQRGLTATRRDGLGSGVAFNALAAGEIDVYVEYSGTVWANLMQRTDVPPRAEVLEGVRTWLAEQHKVTLVGELGFENAYALAMARQRAETLGIRSVADLAAHAGRLSIAGDYEFFGRPEWTKLRDAYGLRFREQRQMQAEFMYPAAAAGEVDVIAAYTSDGRVAQHDLVMLQDPKRAIPPYDAIVLVSPGRAGDRALLGAVQPLLGRIDAARMREANRRASGDASPEQAAAWLSEQIEATREP
jgi:osmoprotectant transport system permease protein